MSGKRCELVQLFDEWRESYASKGLDTQFVADGIIGEDETAYASNSPRVLFLLKDANNSANIFDECGFDLCKLWRHPEKFTCHKLTVERACGIWAAGIASLDKTGRHDYDASAAAFRTALYRAAVLNLKKLAGSNSVSNAEVRRHAMRDRDLIIREISLLAPKIIVCCGTGLFAEVVNPVFGAFVPSNTQFCFRRNGSDTLWIDHCHPAKRVSEKHKYETLMEKYSAWRGFK